MAAHTQPSPMGSSGRAFPRRSATAPVEFAMAAADNLDLSRADAACCSADAACCGEGTDSRESLMGIAREERSDDLDTY